MHIWCEILPCLIGWNYREDLEITERPHWDTYEVSQSTNSLLAESSTNITWHQKKGTRYGEGKCKVTFDKLLILVSS